MRHPCQQTYALRLRAPEGGRPAALAGEIEHVLSGERRGFESGEELLAALAALQRLVPAR